MIAGDRIELELTDWQIERKQLFISAHAKTCTEKYLEGGKEFCRPNFFVCIVGSSGIGPTLSIRCELCKGEEDLTDIDTW